MAAPPRSDEGTTPTMSSPKQIALGLMRYLGYHAAAWRHPSVTPTRRRASTTTALRQTAEAAKRTWSSSPMASGCHQDDRPAPAFAQTLELDRSRPSALAAFAHWSRGDRLTTYNEPFQISRANGPARPSERRRAGEHRHLLVGCRGALNRAAQAWMTSATNARPNSSRSSKALGCLEDDARCSTRRAASSSIIKLHWLNRGQTQVHADHQAHFPQGRPSWCGRCGTGAEIAARSADVVYAAPHDLGAPGPTPISRAGWRSTPRARQPEDQRRDAVRRLHPRRGRRRNTTAERAGDRNWPVLPLCPDGRPPPIRSTGRC